MRPEPLFAPVAVRLAVASFAVASFAVAEPSVRPDRPDDAWCVAHPGPVLIPPLTVKQLWPFMN